MPDIKTDHELSSRTLTEKPTSGVIGSKEYTIHRTQEVIKEEGAMAAARSLEQRGYAEDRYKISVQENIGDKSTRTVGGATENLRDVANRSAEVANRLARDGFAKLGPREQGIVRGQVEASLTKLWPQAVVDIAAKSPAERAAYIDSILLDPAYADVIHELLGRATDSSSPDKQSPKMTEDLKAKLAEIEQNLVENSKKQVEEKAKQTDSRNKLQKEFETTAGVKGLYEVELETLQANRENERKEKEQKERDRIGLASERDSKKQLWDAVLAGRVKASDPDAVKDEAYDANNKLIALDARLLEIEQHEARLTELETKKANYQSEIDNAHKEEQRLIDEEGKLNTEKADLATDKGLSELRIKAHETEYVRDLEQIFDKAGIEYFRKRLEQADAAQLKALGKIAEETGDPVIKAIEKALQTRWSETKRGFLGREKFPLKKDQINDDFRVLLDQDPDALMKRLFGGMALDEGQKQQVTEGLLRKKIEATGISKGEARIIFDSPWGEGLIDSAVAKNDAFKASIDKLKESNGFRGTTGEFMKKHKYVFGGALLLALLGVVGPATAAAGIAYAGKNLAMS